MRNSLIALAALAAWTSSAAATQRDATWDEQNRAMIYLIMDLSSINLINGINLTRDQAARLRDLARQVEAASPPPPDLAATFRPDLAEVRDTYLEARRLLLAGQEVPEALEKRVGKARQIESRVLRLSLAGPTPGASGCARCHGAPGVGDVRTEADAKTVPEKPVPPKPPALQSFLAHESSLVSGVGLVKLAALAPQVDSLLTESQKEGLSSFTCCLVPPKSLSDPVRIGQDTSGEKEIATLRWVRGIPKANWPTVKAWLMEHWKAGIVAKSPGAGEDQKADVCDRVGQIYDQARGLLAMDFELDKNRLATQLREVVTPTKEQGQRQRRFAAAMFLLGPGSVEAYDHLLKRLDAAAKSPA
jgi:hypothetical protein